MQDASAASEADGREEAQDLALADNGPHATDTDATEEVDLSADASSSNPPVRPAWCTAQSQESDKLLRLSVMAMSAAEGCGCDIAHASRGTVLHAGMAQVLP